MIPEIHIWRVANLMIKPYGDTSEVKSARRVDELGHAGDTADVAVWCPIIDAVDQLANTMPPGLVHLDVIDPARRIMALMIGAVSALASVKARWSGDWSWCSPDWLEPQADREWQRIPYTLIPRNWPSRVAVRS